MLAWACSTMPATCQELGMVQALDVLDAFVEDGHELQSTNTTIGTIAFRCPPDITIDIVQSLNFED